MIASDQAFHIAIFDALCTCRGLSASEGIKLIHEAYAEPENVPRPGRNRNVVYWSVLQEPEQTVPAAYNAEAGSTGTHTPVVYATLKYQLVIVC